MDQHAFDGRKRDHSDYSSDDNCDSITLIGSYRAEAGSRIDSISAQHHQQRRCAWQRLSAAPPSATGEEYRFQFSVAPYQDTAININVNPPGGLISNSACSSELSYLDSSFQSFHETPILSTPIQNQSIPFESIMRDQQRRQQRAAARHLTESGSDDSRTLRGSFSTSRQASQGGALDPMLDTSDDVSHPFASDSICSYFPIDGLASGMIGGPATLTTQDQSGHHPGLWQDQDDPPWPSMNASYSQTTVLTQRPRLSPWPEEVLYGPAGGPAVQHPNASSEYPSQISSPLSNASWPPGEIALFSSPLQWSDILQTQAEEYALDNDFMHPENHSLPGIQTQEPTDGENSQLQPLMFNRQSPSFSQPWPHGNSHRSLPLMPKDSAFSDWPPPPNPQVANAISQRTNKFSLNSHPNVPEQDTQLKFKPEVMMPTASSGHEWVQEVGGQTMSKGNKRKKGRRTGPLAEETARKAVQVRHARACWRCWSLHIPCDANSECDRCRRRPSSLTSRICNRVHLCDYLDLFFPNFVVERRDPSVIEQITKDNVKGFTENSVEVEVSPGPAYPTITILVCEFIPTNRDFLFLYHAPPNVNSPVSNLARVYAPPVALQENADDSELRESCYNHIKVITKQSRFPKDATNGDAAPVSLEVLEAVNRFRKSKRVSGNAELIRKVTRLLAMHFFMSKIIAFTKDSANKVVGNLRSPTLLPYGRSMSSKLLNYQIKREVCLLQRELTLEVLEMLHGELRTKSKDSWATKFCVIIILSMCMEAIQLAIDGFLVQKLLSKDATNKPSESRDDGFAFGRRIDERPFGDCIDIFHMMYKSGKFEKESNGKTFNPIRDGVDGERSKGIDDETVSLVNDIRRIMSDHREEIEMKAANPTWGNEENLLVDHYRFRQQNSGRLVAKFLKSFQEVY